MTRGTEEAHHQGSLGFSVIEMLVAMGIMAMAMVPLVALQTQVTRAYRGQAALQERITAQRNALAVLREVNPMRTPLGEREIGGGIRLRWSAKPLTAPRRSLEFLGGDGGFEVALYRLDAAVVAPEGDLTRFAIEQVGWRSLR